MSSNLTLSLLKTYYDAFNHTDLETFLDLLSDDVIHDLNQGERQMGRDAFEKFMHHMNLCYQEQVTDLVIMATDDGKRAAAEFVIEGTYLKTDQGLPKARGQLYRLPVGTFFEIENNKIKRISTYYNLNQWLEMVK